MPLTQVPVLSVKPKVRTTNLRALAFAAAGPEQPYPVYQFSQRRQRFELPQHNPFRGL